MLSACRMEAPKGETGKLAEVLPTIMEIKKESPEEMLGRQRKELTDLQSKEIALKKAAAKGSKAEQKAKKKKVEDDISQLMFQLKSRHSEELASIGFKSENSAGKGNHDNLVMAIAGVSSSNSSDSAKLSKGARRREKRAQQEAEREQRILEEQGRIISDRTIENERLEEKLAPLGLTISEIKPDGHCLYRAIEDQLSLYSDKHGHYSYLELRRIAASYMGEHAVDFLPFFLAEGKIEMDSNDVPLEIFRKYCDEVECTAAWGGQLELGALSHCLKKHIIVFSGYFPDVEMGKEYKTQSEEGFSFNSTTIMLSYHKHAYGLGEHYNSVVPLHLK